MKASFAFIVACVLLVTPAAGADVARVVIEGPEVEVGSGGQYDGGRNPGCQARYQEVCVKPQHGGKLVAGTGKARIKIQNGRTGTQKSKTDTPDEFCLVFWANTGACEIPAFVRGTVVATEEYQKAQ
ncbi:hypothetical protein NLM27_22310 [Bradyrhizobium sp. CCGB12]|uniref:hypothetical protein n=1 Tax=Bradyrhizobium sp. CCGB12 TaxID=2949632 RepID=UPI0020B2AF4B|nr:hypothetical protein [Bradyrhizobium sp. CCGB12]MCP3391525.1 hypothetical protein [Bradyrhizobium sp. CCGB12]